MVEAMTGRSAAMIPADHPARDLFGEMGRRVTQPRIALAELLFGKGDRHVSAESLYAELMRTGAPGSISSVYRNLKDLSGMGFLKRVPIYGSTAWFDTRIEHHHHFYAEDEDRLTDIPAGSIAVANLPSPPAGYELVSVDVLVRVRRIETAQPRSFPPAIPNG